MVQGILGYIKLISTGLTVLAIPLFLVTASVGWAVNDLRLYSYGFDKYDVANITNISRSDLMDAARQIRNYFNSSSEPLEVKVRVQGVQRELFNVREVSHMRDVKVLLRGVYLIALVSGLFLISSICLGFVRYHKIFLDTLAKLVLGGTGLTVGLVFVALLLSISGFDRLFLLFHQLSFANNFWQLDPFRDYLVMMFPQGFWFDATIVVGILCIAEALILGGLAMGWLSWAWVKDCKIKHNFGT